ncbi:TetR family transcriptional regulator [Neptunicella marina]|uniref:TetR family transcriptional regulator n=1 Tax=Neptunicella marina TaxID=2125989 RepID=A0A8J6IUG9_9ALTE|nr:TetR family transcriptional regulator [Neptunicella marina]MBC3766065.1 TetR family transcriptional regulator [Neptunicella marina]
MSFPANPQITTRKQPQQARSNDLVNAILQAAIQVLQTEGAQRFTTTRVAERAGVSVGSLYQYFPNKAAILFRLQTDEWQQTSDMLSAILQNTQHQPMVRLRQMIVAFIQSECEEASMRQALDDAAPLYRDAPEVADARAQTKALYQQFMLELMPDVEAKQREIASELMMNTIKTVGKSFSDESHGAAKILAFSNAMADMLCAYVEKLNT